MAEHGPDDADDAWASLSAWLTGESFEDHYPVRRERASSDGKSPDFLQLVYSVLDGSVQGFAEAVGASVGVWLLHRRESGRSTPPVDVETVEDEGAAATRRLEAPPQDGDSASVDGAPQDS